MTIRSLLLGTAAVALMGSSALAADLYIPETPAPIYEPAHVGFEGLYVGVQFGARFAPIPEEALSFGPFDSGDHDTQFLLGGVVGYNFMADPLLLGIELQGNYYFEGDYFASAGEILALGKIGLVATDNLAVYVTGGVGYVWDDVDNSFSEYALGVGAEYMFTDDLSIRGDWLAVGYENGDGFEASRATLGLLWHF